MAEREQYFREWRLYRKMKQRQVTDKTGYDQSTISRLESGETPYSKEHLEKLARCYRTSPAALIDHNPLVKDPAYEITQTLRNMSPSELAHIAEIVRTFRR